MIRCNKSGRSTISDWSAVVCQLPRVQHPNGADEWGIAQQPAPPFSREEDVVLMS